MTITEDKQPVTPEEGPASTEVAPPNGQVPEDVLQPKLLANKFDDTDEGKQKLEQAYLNAEKALTQANMTRADLEDQLLTVLQDGAKNDSNFAQAPAANASDSSVEGYAPEDNAIIEALQEVVSEAVSSELMPLRIQNSISRISKQYPDFDNKLPDVVNYLKEHPEFKALKNPLEVVYKLIAADSAKEAGIEQAYGNIQRKQNSEPLSQGKKSDTNPSITREWIAGLSPAEYNANRDSILAAMEAGEIK